LDTEVSQKGTIGLGISPWVQDPSIFVCCHRND